MLLPLKHGGSSAMDWNMLDLSVPSPGARNVSSWPVGLVSSDQEVSGGPCDYDGFMSKGAVSES